MLGAKTFFAAFAANIQLMPSIVPPIKPPIKPPINGTILLKEITPFSPALATSLKPTAWLIFKSASAGSLLIAT